MTFIRCEASGLVHLELCKSRPRDRWPSWLDPIEESRVDGQAKSDTRPRAPTRGQYPENERIRQANRGRILRRCSTESKQPLAATAKSGQIAHREGSSKCIGTPQLPIRRQVRMPAAFGGHACRQCTTSGLSSLASCLFSSSWSSLECSPPCHGGDHGFKSRRGR